MWQLESIVIACTFCQVNVLITFTKFYLYILLNCFSFMWKLDFDIYIYIYILLVILGKILRMPHPEIIKKIRQVKITYNIHSDNYTQVKRNYLNAVWSVFKLWYNPFICVDWFLSFFTFLVKAQIELLDDATDTGWGNKFCRIQGHPTRI